MSEAPTPTTRRLRVAVIGAGLMGQRHARAYRSIREVELAAFVDSNDETRARISRLFGVTCHTTWEALFAAEDLDAVSICLPDHTHLEASLASLRQGLAVLLEKPIATSIADAEHIERAASGRLLLVGHMLRFDPRYQRARNLLRAGRIGSPVHLTTRRSSAIGAASRYGGGTTLVFHVAVHDIDLIRWMTGREVVEVYAQGVSHRLAEYGHYDSILALLRLDDGTPCAMEMCWILPAHMGAGLDAQMQIVGTDGRLEVHGLDQGLRISDAAGTEFPDTTRWVEYDDGATGGILTAEIEHFVRCLRDGAQPAVHPSEAVVAVRVTVAMEASLREGRPIAVSAPRR